MKTACETKFDEIIKFVHQILKPLKFKKKQNNFYRQLDEVGQVINFQKSSFYSKNDIHFTINIGIFEPKFWSSSKAKEIPKFPKEYECFLRLRIGKLKSDRDIWYDVNQEDELENTIKSDLNDFILPFFEKLNSIEKLIEFITNNHGFAHNSEKMKFLVAHNELGKAKELYTVLLKTTTNENFLKMLLAYGKEHNLE